MVIDHSEMPEDFFPNWEYCLRKRREHFPRIEEIVRIAMTTVVDALCSDKLSSCMLKAPVDLDMAAQILGFRISRRKVIGPQISHREKIIWLSDTDPKYEDRLNLGHELAHSFYRTEGVSQYHFHDMFEISKHETEYLCDRTSEILVVPKHLLLHNVAAFAEPRSSLRDLANIFEVSSEIIGRRLEDIHFSNNQLSLF